MFRVPLCVARQQLVHERQEPIPPPGLLLERLAPCTGDGIHLRLTVGRSLLPGPFDPAPLFQAHQAAYMVPAFKGSAPSAISSKRDASP
jgi:hypothetical protein